MRRAPRRPMQAGTRGPRLPGAPRRPALVHRGPDGVGRRPRRDGGRVPAALSAGARGLVGADQRGGDRGQRDDGGQRRGRQRRAAGRGCRPPCSAGVPRSSSSSVQAGELAEDRHGGAVVAARQPAGTGRCRPSRRRAGAGEEARRVERRAAARRAGASCGAHRRRCRRCTGARRAVDAVACGVGVVVVVVAVAVGLRGGAAGVPPGVAAGPRAAPGRSPAGSCGRFTLGRLGSGDRVLTMNGVGTPMARRSRPL